ncbi:MAG: glycosyltransferase family 4 protein [Phycisphaeraceae bacterium]|nr:glycosyltransferase family 4 protein [Phycisphaeraceae bacterium]
MDAPPPFSGAAEGPPVTTPPVVLHVRVVTHSGGGPDKTILRSPRYADASRYTIEAAYIHPRRDPGFDVIRNHADAQHCTLWPIAESCPLDPRTVFALARLCRQRRVRIWHGHDYKSNALGLLVRRWHPMHLVTTVHGWTHDTLRAKLYYHLDNRCIPRYEHVLAVSPPLADHCRKLGVPDDRLTYVPNGIDADEYSRARDIAAAKASLQLPGDRIAIGVVGRLSVEKGVDRAVRVLPALLKLNPNVELMLIGDGPQRGQLEQLARELNITDRVRFLGWQKQTKPFLEAMDLLLLPSLTEGLPNAVLEAMAMRVPVVATDVGAVRDLLDRGQCGRIVSHDLVTWPDAMTSLLIDPELRRHLADLARARVETRYSFHQRMRTVMAIYDHVLSLDASPALQHKPA